MLPRPGVVVCVIHENSWYNLWAFVLKVNMNYHKLTINFLCVDISETGDVGVLARDARRKATLS